MRSSRRLCIVSMGALLLAAGCAEPGSEPDSSNSSQATTQATTTTETSPPQATESSPATAGPSFEQEAAPTSADGTSQGAVLVAITVTDEGGYDRVTITFEGTGAPGFLAQYVEQAAREAIGDPIDIPGSVALLDVLISGTTYPPEQGGGLSAGLIADGAGSVVTGVFNDGTFEGQTHVVIGTSSQAPFLVSATADPPSIIVDIAA